MNRDDLRHFFFKNERVTAVLICGNVAWHHFLWFLRKVEQIFILRCMRVLIVLPRPQPVRHTNTCNLDITDLFTNLFLTATAGVSNMERGNSRQIFAKCRSKSNSKKIIRDRAHELQICHEDRWQSLFLSLNRCKAVGSYYIREPSFT